MTPVRSSAEEACPAQLERTPPSSFADYRRAAALLWGEAGAFLVDTYQVLNARYFADTLPPRPIVIGLTAYGHCLGITRFDGPWTGGPRITIASGQFRKGTRHVEDLVLHEMIHVTLILAKENHRHNAWPWCREIARLSPRVLGHAIQVEPVTTRRIPGTTARTRAPRLGFLARIDLARWPHSCRTGTEDPGLVLSTASY
jgi:hypothetical protein